MKGETLIIILTLFFAVNAYYDGKYLKELTKWKKHYKVAGYLFAGISLYAFLKKNPNQGKSLIQCANDFVTTMPIDRDAKDFLTPILNAANNDTIDQNTPQFKRMMNSGKISTRSVSETKKKYVASSQDWKCFSCRMKLPASFEVDHKIRLDRGGTNEVNNLIAYCRNCHGEKTALETL